MGIRWYEGHFHNKVTWWNQGGPGVWWDLAQLKQETDPAQHPELDSCLAKQNLQQQKQKYIFPVTSRNEKLYCTAFFPLLPFEVNIN